MGFKRAARLLNGTKGLFRRNDFYRQPRRLGDIISQMKTYMFHFSFEQSCILKPW